jgi:hypothetical protein
VRKVSLLGRIDGAVRSGSASPIDALATRRRRRGEPPVGSSIRLSAVDVYAPWRKSAEISGLAELAEFVRGYRQVVQMWANALFLPPRRHWPLKQHDGS